MTKCKEGQFDRNVRSQIHEGHALGREGLTVSAYPNSLDPPYGFSKNGKPRKRPYLRHGVNNITVEAEYAARVLGHLTPYDFRGLAGVDGPVFTQRHAQAWSVEFVSEQKITTSKRHSHIKIWKPTGRGGLGCVTSS